MHRQPPSDPAGVVLIGFRATGKSTVGRLLADRLGLTFVDMDQVLIDRHGPIDELVARHGWPHFRELERQLLEELAQKRGLVIATGGGAVLHRDFWPQILARYLVVWLQVPEAVIRERLLADSRTDSQRPALTGADPAAEIGRVLAERLPLYEASCHLALDGTVEPSAIAAAIAVRWPEDRRP